MKNQRGSSSHGLLSIKSLWNTPQNTGDASIERTFSNDSTIEKDRDVIKHQVRKAHSAAPPSPTSVSHCDIFRPLRETFFSDEMENMLTLRRARPLCCGSLMDLDEDDDEDEDEKREDEAVSPLPLTRQDALMTTLEMIERSEESTVDSGIPQVVGLEEHESLVKYSER